MASTAPSRSVVGRNRLLTAPAVAGVAYLVAWVAGLAAAAFVSGPLLVVWVTATGISLAGPQENH